MADRLAGVVARLQNLPSLSLPTDYPRPTEGTRLIEAAHVADLSAQTASSLMRLALYTEDGDEDEDNDEDADDKIQTQHPPSAFHLLLSAFVVLLHRYTGDTDIVIGSSSATVREPLVLRLAIDPSDPFWAVVRRVQQVENEAEANAVPFDALRRALSKGSEEAAPLFRVRFFDETDQVKDPHFIRTTQLTSDLTIFITRPPTTTTRTSLAPRISLRIIYNSLLFSQRRISYIIEQLSVLLRKVSLNPLAPVGSVPLLTPSQISSLPVPTVDLDWCGWKGAITDIFSSNARSYPDRPCVIQGIPTVHCLEEAAQSSVTYTYGQIRRAANTLAHHLLAGGVQREEVVMVYAHRSVELVVAVMAVLKTGATFSVIDPAYPSTRQTIYLQVAQPRGLVVLKGAGKISPVVREFLSTSLQIRVEVPALEILPDGTLLGGAPGLNEVDVLADQVQLADVDPNVVLGPDSIGTLSFTSGSTGVPKGVRGRHFSLTHFFPWMGEKFGLSEQSKFTMLSGIAHDPIQRDIFTPLFFGAQLHVPTADDIGTPGRLAEWMASSQVTVTHLTPAMGQLLSAQATVAIPTLRAAFFVGDILTKRDCLRLQSLAVHVRIVNMYGTTETQRAVSYFEIPSRAEDASFLSSQKDVVPAGQGMVDVQLVVVNRYDKRVPCAVGEVGEIYVRSGGLAEGYLDSAATAEKFVMNWFACGDGDDDGGGLSVIERRDTLLYPMHGFAAGPEAKYWKGIRDRMYRSGDLGRYLVDGRVECTGRADDQIKIRGFRIELGEIDMHLSQHALVRENVTLVRRDKDEEKMLVSYVVPLEGPGLDGFASEDGVGEEEQQQGGGALVAGMRRYRRLIKHIREYLKTKLPSYSVPSIIVPLKRMPLNPNGKIDKPALPFPDTAQASSSSSFHITSGNAAAVNPTEHKMQRIWAQILPNAPCPIPLDESFFDLGGHSILATRLIFEIRSAFVVDAPLGLVFEQPTVRGLVAAVEALRNADLGLDYQQQQQQQQQKSTVRAPTTDEEEVKYGQDYIRLRDERLKRSYDPLPSDSVGRNGRVTIFLTGATGFLGAFVLKELLGRERRVNKVICLVRGSDDEQGMERLREGSRDRGVWDERWVREGRVEVVVGDLGLGLFGLGQRTWERVAGEVDVVLHNGALVHWVYPYERLRAANVMATLTAIDLASASRPKALVFVSSTSAIDTPHYVNLSETLARGSSGLRGIPESDDLEGAKVHLKTGYGQTKWVSEKLLLEAGKRGLVGYIVRPGYVVGDSRTAVTNTDDFIWRMVKGCIQLGVVPNINNTINMVPVDHVALCTSLAAVTPVCDGMRVLHIQASPLPTFNSVLSALWRYGYAVEGCEYVAWRVRLERHAVEDNALFPLLHFVLDDLPTSTKAPELDDRNTRGVLEQEPDGVTSVDEELMGKYLGWLVAARFLPPPSRRDGRALPVMDGAGVMKAHGRSGI